LKILIVVPNLSAAGPQAQICALAGAWIRSGHGCWVLDLAPEQRDIAFVQARLHPEAALIERDVHASRLFDVVVSTGRQADAFVAERVERLRRPGSDGFWWSRQAGDWTEAAAAVNGKAVLGKADGHIVQSPEQRAMLQRMGIPSEQIWFMHNGVVPPQQVFPETQNEEGPLRCVMCARGEALKGWSTAMDAVNQLRERGIRVTLDLIGKGPGLDALRAEAGPGVRFLGHQARPALAYPGRYDVGLLPTRFGTEGLPNSIIEYLNAGMPVIATAVGGVPMLLADPELPAAGILLQDPTDTAELRAAIRAYCDNRALLADHRSGAAAMRAHRLNIDHVAAMWLKNTERRSPGTFDKQ